MMALMWIRQQLAGGEGKDRHVHIVYVVSERNVNEGTQRSQCSRVSEAQIPAAAVCMQW